jgi:hypothetical protein
MTTEHILDRALHLLSRKFGQRSETLHNPSEEVIARLAQFGARRLAILIDENTDIKELRKITQRLSKELKIELAGVYSFSLEMISRNVHGFSVRPLMPDRPLEDVDAWLLSAGNRLAQYSLNQYLLDQHKEHQAIVKHTKDKLSTRYYSYIDFFSNDEQETKIQFHNYFERLYGNQFPLALFLTLRDRCGKVLECKQIIIPTNGIVSVTSETFSASQFEGYLEAEFDVNSKVQPFLHYYATYQSDDFISGNHQAGLGLLPAGSNFTRGYIPADENETMVVSIFQRNYSAPIVVKGTLKYLDETGLNQIERNFPPLARNFMLVQDVKRLFSDVDFSAVKSAQIEICADVPLHRPNYYYARKGKKGYYDVQHGGPDPKTYATSFGTSVVNDKGKAKFKENDCYPMDLRQFVFPAAMGIESLIGLGNDTTATIKQFRIGWYNESGTLLKSIVHYFDYDNERFINLNHLASQNGIKDFSGAVSLRPLDDTVVVPIILNGISAYRSVRNPYITSTAASGAIPNNTPFYFLSGPPNYFDENCHTGRTNIYGPAFYSDTFDTYFGISFACSYTGAHKNAEYQIQIFNSAGKSRIIERELKANGTDYLKLSELVEELNFRSEDGNYCLWIFSIGATLYAQRIVVRKSDWAIAVEHCYVGKYGVT